MRHIIVMTYLLSVFSQAFCGSTNGHLQKKNIQALTPQQAPTPVTYSLYITPSIVDQFRNVILPNKYLLPIDSTTIERIENNTRYVRDDAHSFYGLELSNKQSYKSKVTCCHKYADIPTHFSRLSSTELFYGDTAILQDSIEAFNGVKAGQIYQLNQICTQLHKIDRAQSRLYKLSSREEFVQSVAKKEAKRLCQEFSKASGCLPAVRSSIPLDITWDILVDFNSVNNNDDVSYIQQETYSDLDENHYFMGCGTYGPIQRYLHVLTNSGLCCDKIEIVDFCTKCRAISYDNVFSGEVLALISDREDKFVNWVIVDNNREMDAIAEEVDTPFEQIPRFTTIPLKIPQNFN